MSDRKSTTSTTSTKRRCTGKTKAGKRCKAAPLKGKKACSAHDPDTPASTRFGSPEQARAAGVQGGRPRAPRPSEVAQAILERNITAVLRPYFRALGLELHEDGTVSECDGPIKYVWGGTDEPAIPMLDLGAQMQAAEKLQDRIYGKPRQAVEVTGQDGGAVEHGVSIDAESREIIGELLRRRAHARE